MLFFSYSTLFKPVSAPLFYTFFAFFLVLITSFYNSKKNFFSLFYLAIICIINLYFLKIDNYFFKQWLIFIIGINSLLLSYIAFKLNIISNNLVYYIKILIIYLTIIILIGYFKYIFGYYNDNDIYVNPLFRISSFGFFSVTYAEGVRNSEQLLYLLNSFLSLIMYNYSKRKIYLYIIYFSLLALVIGQSRAFYLSLFFILIFNFKIFYVFLKDLNNKLKIKFYFYLLILALLFHKLIIQIIASIFSIFFPDFSTKITSNFEMGWMYSNKTRLDIYYSGVKDIFMNPKGYGFSNSIPSLEIINHNQFINYESTLLEIALTMGIYFAVIYLLFYIYLGYKAYKNFPNSRILISFLITLLFINTFDSQISSILYWFTITNITIFILNGKNFVRNSI